MAKPLSTTELRANIYKVLDEVIETSQPREIRRKGETVLLVPTGSGRRRKLDNLPRLKGVLHCSADDLVDTSFDYVPDDDQFPPPA